MLRGTEKRKSAARGSAQARAGAFPRPAARLALPGLSKPQHLGAFPTTQLSLEGEERRGAR